MTQSTPEKEPSTSELVGLGAQAVVDNAQRLGLTWTLRPATVAATIDTISNNPNSGIITVVFDGDTAEVSASSMVGALSAGERVMVLVVPPAGNFVVGLSTSISLPYAPGRGIVGSHTETSNSGAITTITTIMTTDQDVLFRSDRAYEFTFVHNHFSSAAGVLAQYAVNLLGSGTSLVMGNFRTEGAASTGVFCSKVGVRLRGTNTLNKVELTALAVSGNITILGSVTTPRQFWVRDVGPASMYPGFFEIL